MVTQVSDRIWKNKKGGTQLQWRFIPGEAILKITQQYNHNYRII